MFGLLEDDTWALLKLFWKNYPVLWILFITYIFFLFFKKIINKNFSANLTVSQRLSFIFSRLLIIFFLFIGARGTFSLFPLGDHDTVISSNPFLNTLSYGTAHAFSRAIKLKREQKQMGTTSWNANLTEFGYLNHEDKAFEDYFEKKIPQGSKRYDLMKFTTSLNIKSSENLAPKPHVVLVVMESWGNYGLQFNEKNFDLVGLMKPHLQENLLNTQMQSATPGTTGSLSCLLAGLPQRAISAFLTESDYLQTSFSTSPAHIYHKQGYQTQFVYGGNPGWRDINKFALSQGYQHVLGEIDIKKKLSSYNTPVQEQHDWGIFDEDLFKYIQILLAEATTPQLIVVMTTTNHPPYDLPKNYNLDSFKKVFKNRKISVKAVLLNQNLINYIKLN